jgi:YfiH family protein
LFYKDPQNVYRVREFEEFPWLEHGFGTRASGRWVRGPLATLKQVHSNTCVAADGRTGCLAQADALVSNTPGLWVAIHTADCLPVLIVDPVRRAVAAAHAGWRGTAASIAMRAVEKLEAQFGSRPADLLAAIGPGICGKCYTVGAEVAAQFARWFPDRSDLNQQTTLDLAETNRRQLIAAGLSAGAIYTGAPCTACHADEFYSYRVQGKTGRLLSAVGIKGG